VCTFDKSHNTVTCTQKEYPIDYTGTSVFSSEKDAKMFSDKMYQKSTCKTTQQVIMQFFAIIKTSDISTKNIRQIKMCVMSEVFFQHLYHNVNVYLAAGIFTSLH
jgi:hypothetical protein